MNNYSRREKTKPLPYALAKDGNKIKYRCRRCGADMSYYHRDEKYCHSCGGAVEWDVPEECSEQFRRKYNIVINEPESAARTTKLTNLFFSEFKEQVYSYGESQK